MGLLSPGHHFVISYDAARDSGMGVADSIKLGIDSVVADFGTQGTSSDDTNQHAMAGDGQTSSEAIAATKDWMSDSSRDLGSRIHAGQDLATPEHAGKSWDGFGFNKKTFKHLWGDFFPTRDVMDNAYDNTKCILDNQ